MPVGDRLSASGDPLQLFAWGQTVRRAHRQARLVAAFEAGDPHHEEFVRDWTRRSPGTWPLQQRLRGVLSEREDSGLKSSQLNSRLR